MNVDILSQSFMFAFIIGGAFHFNEQAYLSMVVAILPLVVYIAFQTLNFDIRTELLVNFHFFLYLLFFAVRVALTLDNFVTTDLFMFKYL